MEDTPTDLLTAMLFNPVLDNPTDRANQRLQWSHNDEKSEIENNGTNQTTTLSMEIDDLIDVNDPTMTEMNDSEVQANPVAFNPAQVT